MTHESPARDAVDLLPCPFCGGSASLKQDHDYNTGEPNGLWWVQCDPCDMFPDSAWGKSKEEAVAAWNRRTTPSPSSEYARGWPEYGTDIADAFDAYVKEHSSMIGNFGCTERMPATFRWYEAWERIRDAINKRSPSPSKEGEARLRMFLEILSAMGGKSDASESKWSWINAFCEPHEGGSPDTFNLAIERGYTRSTHDSDTDHSVVWLTEAGSAALSPTPALEGVVPDGWQGAVEIIRQIASMEGRTDAQTYWFGKARDFMAALAAAPKGAK
jgi:Lar family restriction alleviation protein